MTATDERTKKRELATAFANDLAPIGPVQTRAQFGGVALVLDGVQFGFVEYGRLYLRVDDQSRPEFERAGSEPFQFASKGGRSVVASSFYSTPAEVLADPARLIQWARAAHQVAVAAARQKRPSRRRAQ